MKIKSYLREYDVVVSDEIDLAAVIGEYENRVIVIDKNVYEIHKHSAGVC